ncbi:MAG TPA: hypothetical protein V6C71_06565 [Coleofasciculaceae cyanobacterium]|jgi:hypothetical protein
MLSFFSLDLRRILTIFLVSITLCFGIAFSGNTSAMAAEAVTRDATNLNSVDVVSDAQYEADKLRRQEEQAMRSKMAEPDQEKESVVEKLNLKEALPRSTKKFVEQIKGDEPINNETHP